MVQAVSGKKVWLVGLALLAGLIGYYSVTSFWAAESKSTAVSVDDFTRNDARLYEKAKSMAASGDPAKQIASLAQIAGLNNAALEASIEDFPPEAIMGALEAAELNDDPSASSNLLARWAAYTGGRKRAGEIAHDLLLQGRLPYGGGRQALALMLEVNDPQAILVGLRGFVVDSALPPEVRTESLILLRSRMADDAYLKFVRDTAAAAQREGDPWAVSATRYAEWFEGPPAHADEPLTIDRLRIETMFARPYPDMVRDLEILLKHQSDLFNFKPEAKIALEHLLSQRESNYSITVPERNAISSLRQRLGR